MSYYEAYGYWVPTPGKGNQAGTGALISCGNVSGPNVNLGEQGDVVNGVGGDCVKGVGGDYIKGVKGNVNKNGPGRDIIRGDRGGDGGNCYNGGYAGAGVLARGNNAFSYLK
jgi:hypothetical protein